MRQTALCACGLPAVVPDRFQPSGRAALLPGRSDRARPETQDASRVRTSASAIHVRLRGELLPRRRRQGAKRALNVNTVDEVPDSSWFTNRLGAPMTVERDRPRADRGTGPVGALEGDGRQERRGHARAHDSRRPAGEVFGSSSTRRSNLEMASGAEVISTKFFHAFGYHVPENYLATLGGTLRSTAGATIEGQGRPRPSRAMISTTCSSAPPRADGSTASWRAGTFQGSRSDRSNTTARGPTTRTTSSRTSTGASCAGCSSFGVAQSRRLAQHELARHAGRRRRPRHRPSPPARLRVDARQRQRSGAEPARGQRVRVGGAADVHHDADAGPLRASVDQRPTPRHARRRADRGHHSTRRWKPDYPNPAFRKCPAGRPLLGGEHRGRLSDETSPRWSSRRRNSVTRGGRSTSRHAARTAARKCSAWLTARNPIVASVLSRPACSRSRMQP